MEQTNEQRFGLISELMDMYRTLDEYFPRMFSGPTFELSTRIGEAEKKIKSGEPISPEEISDIRREYELLTKNIQNN